MSSQVTSTIWDLPTVTPLEKLVLIWIADNQADFEEGCMVDLKRHRKSLTRFTGQNITTCRVAMKDLHARGVIFYRSNHATILQKAKKP